MKFLLMIIDDEPALSKLSEAEMNSLFSQVGAVEKELKSRGKLMDGRALKPSSEGKLVVGKDGDRTVSSGGLTVGGRAIGGYFLIECASDQEAIDWAKRFPIVGNSAVEVRPILEFN